MIRSFMKWIRGFCPHITLLQKPVFVIDHNILGFRPPVWGASIILTALFFSISMQPVVFYGQYVRDMHHFQAINETNYEYVYNLNFDVNDFSKLASDYNLIYRFAYHEDNFNVPLTVYHSFFVNGKHIEDASFIFQSISGSGGLGDSPIQIPKNYLVNGGNIASIH